MTDPATESIPSSPTARKSELELMHEAQKLAHVGFSVYVTATVQFATWPKARNATDC